jgi:hypothetical protein
MKVYVKGAGEVTLSSSNFVAQGGQASVYQKAGTAYKVYTDPKDTIAESKFNELSGITDPNVIKPEKLLIDPKRSQPIGYTMRFISDTHALCQLFTRSFRDRHNLSHARIQSIVAALQSHLESVHSAGLLVVDLNELNILTDQTIEEVFLIDVDSYQTPSSPATVIMPSVRDWSVRPAQFSTASDWFSFAVLMCQLYIGIHPYKGKHDATEKMPADERLKHRMQHNISVFDSSVRVPRVCFPTDVIPPHQRAWLEAVLQEGKRGHPPSPREPIAVTLTAHASLPKFSSGLEVEELRDYGHPVRWCSDSVVSTSVSVRYPGGTWLQSFDGVTLWGTTPKQGRPIGLCLHRGKLSLIEPDHRRITEVSSSAIEIAKAGERFCVRTALHVFEVGFIEQPTATVFSAVHAVAQVVESATRLFEGCAIQSLLGSVFVSLFTAPRTGAQHRAPQLDAYKIIDAKYEGGVLMVIGATRTGTYDRLVFTGDMTRADRVVRDIGPSSANFIVRSGTCIALAESDQLELFAVAKPNSVRMVDDAALGSDMRLIHLAGRVAFIRGNRVFSLRMT